MIILDVWYIIGAMKGVVIVNQYIGHNQYKIDRFYEEFPKLGIDFDVVSNDGTLARIKDSKVIVNIPKCDFVIYLDKDIYLARLLERAGYRLFNRADFIKMCDDKMLTFINCANLDIKMPETIAGPLVYTDLEEKNYDFLNKIETELGFPLIVKRVYGSLGEGVYLAHNMEELRELYSKIYRNPLLFQKYVPSKYGKSIRVLIIDGKVVGGFVRYNKDDFRSNYGDNANGELLDNPKDCYEFSQRIADLLKIEYAGIDLLLEPDGKPTLCEINSNAFFEEFEKVTGINIAYRIGEMIKNKLENE